MKLVRIWFLLGIGIVFTGCATSLPRPGSEPTELGEGRSGKDLLEESLAAHGGDIRKAVSDLNVAVTGEWGNLIRKIQPLVTDFKYRIRSEERLLPESEIYSVKWTGPAGTKTIVRSKDETLVWYNGERSEDEDVLASSAMTSDAFQLFHFGPSFLFWRGTEYTRLSDFREEGRLYHRVHVKLEPGFGRSPADEAVVYIDPESMLLHRVWITLEGFRTTKGASVDVTFLEYGQLAGLTLPRKFVERVRAPISIHAHAWEVTSWDANRGYGPEAIGGPIFSGAAGERESVFSNR